MATATQVSLEDYLHTSYEPDAEYVDGEIEERNAGEYDHNTVQMQLTFWFHQHRREWRLRSVIEQRTLLSPRRVRIPDVSIFRREMPVEQVFTYPQLIAIEVLSPEDRQSRLQQRIQDFIDFGVKNIWLLTQRSALGGIAATATGRARSGLKSGEWRSTFRRRSCSPGLMRMNGTDAAVAWLVYGRNSCSSSRMRSRMCSLG